MDVNFIQAQIDKFSNLWATTQSEYDSGNLSLDKKNELQAKYHTAAENFRDQLGYSGGADGSKMIIKDQSLVSKTMGITKSVLNETSQTIEKVLSGGSDAPKLTPDQEAFNYVLGGGTEKLYDGDPVQALKNWFSWIPGINGEFIEERYINNPPDMNGDGLPVDGGGFFGGSGAGGSSAGGSNGSSGDGSNNPYDWLEKNKLWVVGSIVALLGIVILDD